MEKKGKRPRGKRTRKNNKVVNSDLEEKVDEEKESSVPETLDQDNLNKETTLKGGFLEVEPTTENVERDTIYPPCIQEDSMKKQIKHNPHVPRIILNSNLKTNNMKEGIQTRSKTRNMGMVPPKNEDTRNINTNRKEFDSEHTKKQFNSYNDPRKSQQTNNQQYHGDRRNYRHNSYRNPNHNSNSFNHHPSNNSNNNTSNAFNKGSSGTYNNRSSNSWMNDKFNKSNVTNRGSSGTNSNHSSNSWINVKFNGPNVTNRSSSSNFNNPSSNTWTDDKSNSLNDRPYGDWNKNQIEHPSKDWNDMVEQDEEDWDKEINSAQGSNQEINSNKYHCVINSPGSSNLNPSADSFHMPSSPYLKDYLKQENEEELLDSLSLSSPSCQKKSKITYKSELMDENSHISHNQESINSWENYPDSNDEINLISSNQKSDCDWKNKSDSNVISQKSSSMSREFSPVFRSSFESKVERKSMDSSYSSSSSRYNDQKQDSWRNDSGSYKTKYKTNKPRNSFLQRKLDDDEWNEFCENHVNQSQDFIKVNEIQSDLFTMDNDYALGHCVAADFYMGSGIALEFRKVFKRVDELLDQKQKPGGLALLKDNNGRIIYYLVTKSKSIGKPDYSTLWSSLKKMRDHITTNDVKKLALPKIGCGLDRLDWDIVKPMIEFLFKEVDIEIVVCNFQQDESSVSPRNPLRKCPIKHESYSITAIENYTIIVYFASVDGTVTNIMKELDEKFHYLLDFRRQKRVLGEPVLFKSNLNYVLYGCIVKEKVDDSINFTHFNKCLQVINKDNKKNPYNYVGFQKVIDENDDIINDKILNIMKYSLRNVEIYCCNSVNPDNSFN